MERDANSLLRTLEGQTIQTLTGHPNTTLWVREEDDLVGTLRSSEGEWVPVAVVQDGLHFNRWLIPPESL